MTKIKYAWAAVLLFSVCRAQFFYNDDEQPAYHDPPPPPQDNTYQHDNPPAAEQYRPSQRSSHSENFRQPVSYQPTSRVPPPASVPQYEHRPETSRDRRRGGERRQRQPPPPRVYSPSVFENLALGKPPTGVSIPEDSFLNVLTNGGRAPRARQSPAYEPPPPQQTSYVESPPQQTSYVESPPPQHTSYAQPPPAQARPPPRQQTLYVQPPSQARPPPRQQTLFVQSPPPRARSPPAYAQNPPAPPPRVQRAQAPPPAVHNLPHIEGAQPETIENPVQYQAPPAPVQPRPQRSSRRRSGVRSWNSADEDSQRPRRVFGPSVFENLGPGMAPPGIHVPEDSFLNILRNDKPNIRTRRDQDYDYEPAPPVAPVTQYAPPTQYSTESRPSTQEFSTDYEHPQEIPVVQPAPRKVSRQHQRPSPPPEYVDNTANHQTNDEHSRVVKQQKPVQSRRRVSVRRHRQYSGSIPDADENGEEIYRPPKQFAPSVFEKIGLGQAPPGINIPEDSFLNLLRGDKPATRSSQSSGNRRSGHVSQNAPFSEAAPVISEDVYDQQNRRSRASQAIQSPPQQHQSIPVQEYQPVNAQPHREVRRPIPHEEPQPAPVPPRAVQPPQRQRQRSRSQPVSPPQPQPVYEAPSATYNGRSDLLVDDYTLRYRSQDNNQRIRQQEQVPQRKRVNTAPRYVPPPPPQPVYEAPQPNYDDSSSFEPEDIQRRRPPSRNQRPVRIEQPVQRPRADSQSHRRRPPPQPQPTRNDEVRGTRQQTQFKPAKLSVKPLPDDVDGDQIPGEAGIDYPTFHVIPSTSFSCSQQPHNGYYADLETSCQVVHLCQSGGVQNSFLCPNGTIFNQEKFSCQWWYKVNCADAPSHYGINDKLYKTPPPPSRRRMEGEI